MTSQSGQIEEMALANLKHGTPEPSDRGWKAFSATLTGVVRWPECSRDGKTWTVRLGLGADERTFSAESMRDLIALVKSDRGMS